MLGTKAVKEARRHKQALLLESGLNRLKLKAELQRLRSAAEPLSGLTGGSRKLLPLMVVLAPIAGYFAARTLRRKDSVPGRLASAIKLILPLYELWRRFSAARRPGRADPETGASAAP